MRRRKCASSSLPLYIWHTCTFKIHTYHIYHMYIYVTLKWHIYSIMVDILEDESASSSPLIYTCMYL